MIYGKRLRKRWKMKKKPEVHCWQDYQDTLDKDYLSFYESFGFEHGRTCLLLRGHEGEHEWTNDDEIIITFIGDDEEKV
ncbi:hypothetical protein LCGC14_1426400 [marine sediment metagenome]|uniref:Uncharacterized protein n=1 Tax=marine sediment metagenome TaxID=412755 RepID=A0A0F9KB09_9ZZZZ